jgi:hypothetical protein
MSCQKGNIINRLISKWPSETVAVYEWLNKQGAYYQLVDKYVKSGWLRRIGKGAFVRLGEQIDWTGGLYAIQNNMNLPVHASGITALQLQGYAHFIPLGPDSKIYLAGTPGTNLPKWFLDYPWQVDIRFKTSTLFGNSGDIGVVSQGIKAYEIRISVPERAMMEFLSDVPNEASIEHAHLLMEGLTTLRAGFIQKLLEECRSVKVKRVFLFLAEYCNHKWFTKLDTSKLNLGKGKRMVVKDGKLDSKYLITVPSDLVRE